MDAFDMYNDSPSYKEAMINELLQTIMDLNPPTERNEDFWYEVEECINIAAGRV